MAFFKVKDVYKNFGSNKVLKGIDFELDEGQVLAIIGSSGSGKTTLLRCINFLEIPDKADIYLNGENILSLIHISEPTRPSEISYAVFCLKKIFLMIRRPPRSTL